MDSKDGTQSESQIRSSDVVLPPPGEYIEVDEDEGSKYPLHVNYDTWLSEEEGATLLKELQAAMDYLTTKRQNDPDQRPGELPKV